VAPLDDQVVSVSEALVWSSGCIRLPSQRTLRDYTHCVSATTGFLSTVDQQLMRAADVDKCPERQKYLALILDKMYVKEDLVYNKHSGAFIGFHNLGNINEHLLQFQASLEHHLPQGQKSLFNQLKGSVLPVGSTAPAQDYEKLFCQQESNALGKFTHR